ncbi:MAG TPA: hypothetical protein DCP84_14650 [Pseudomonas sp.]|nr:hypothetical protein [Pseudomonas sp.]
MKSLEKCSIEPEYTERPAACLCKYRPAGQAILGADLHLFAVRAALRAKWLARTLAKPLHSSASARIVPGLPVTPPISRFLQ